MKLSLAAIVLSATFAGPVVAAPPSETAALVKVVAAFAASQDPVAADALFLPNAAISDEVPPYSFRGPHAASTWMAAFAADLKANGQSDPQIKLGEATYVRVDRRSAYIVIPTLYSFKQGDQRLHENGHVVATLKKAARTWKIASFTWAGETPVP